MLLAFEVDSLRQLFECFLVRLLLLLSKEQAAKCLVEASVKLLEFSGSYKGVVGVGP